MALDKKIQDYLRSNLNRAAGRGLHVKPDDAKLIDAPILAVGLGGTGADALLRLKHLVNERLNTNSIKDKPDNIEYLAIDTDPRTKFAQYEGTTFVDSNSEICIMEDAKLAQTYASLASNQSPHISSWISTDLSMGQISNGAGGIRQIGRFLFFKEFLRLEQEITSKIEKIIKGRTPNSSKAYVFITAGISGGTGSGIFLDLPYVIRKILERAGFEAQILGFIFLPDVNLQVITSDDRATARNIQRNGFAALKELDYLMNLGNGGNGEKFEQDYGNNFQISMSRPPYDICHLVSSINQSGVNNFTKENCMIVTAETLLNFIADEHNIGTQFTIAQYISNIENTTASFISDLTVRRPIHYRYNVIGSSSGVMPMDDILNYLTHLLFKEMDVLYKRSLQKSEVIHYAQQFRLSFDSIETAIMNNVVLQDIELYDYDSIKNSPMAVENVLKSCIDDTLADIMARNALNFTMEFEQNIESSLEHVFTDLDKGPFYASKLIYSTDDYCLLKFIKDQIDGEVIAGKVNAIEIKRLKDLVAVTRKKLLETNPFLGFGKNGLAEEHRKACKNLYTAILKNQIHDAMYQCYDRLYNILNNKNNKIFNVMTEMLTLLKDIFNDYAGIESRTNTNVQGTQTTFTWQIVDTADLASEVRLMIHKDPAYAINFKKVIDDFVKDLIENSNEWINAEKPATIEKLNQFIISSFGSIVLRSIDFYINRIADGDDNKEAGIIQKAVKTLSEQSKVMFPLSIFGATFQPPTYRYVAVPFNSKHFKNIQNTKIIKESVITNRIFMLNVNVAYPLMAYRELEEYEKTYETFVGKVAAGMHLYEKGSKNWADLPSPIYDRAAKPSYVNPRVTAKNDSLREVFDKAVQYGYIKYDESAKKHNCFYNNDPLPTSATSGAQQLTTKSDIQRAITEINGLLTNPSRYTEQTSLYDELIHPHTNEVDVEYAKGVFINMPELNRKITRMVKEHETLLEISASLVEKAKGFDIYNKFAAVLYTGLIQKKRAKFIFENSEQLEKILFYVDASCPDEYYDYYLLQGFSALDKEEREFLYKKSQELINNADDEQMEIFKAEMKRYYKDFDEKRQELKSGYSSIVDGVKKADFYSELREEMQKAIRLYS